MSLLLHRVLLRVLWVLFKQRWRSLAKVLRRVLCKVLCKVLCSAVGCCPGCGGGSGKGAAQAAAQGAVQGTVQGAELPWLSLAKMLCRVLCRVFCAWCCGPLFSACCAYVQFWFYISRLLHTLLHPDSKCVQDFGAYAHSFPRPLVTCHHLDQSQEEAPGEQLGLGIRWKPSHPSRGGRGGRGAGATATSGGGSQR